MIMDVPFKDEGKGEVPASSEEVLDGVQVSFPGVPEEAPSGPSAEGGYNSIEYSNMREDYINFSKEKFETFKIFNSVLMAVSTAFIGGIVALKDKIFELKYPWLVLTSGMLFAATIMLSILELYFSQLAYAREMENLSIRYKEHDYEMVLCNRFAGFCWGAILFSAITSGLAVVFICVFFVFNLNYKGNKPMSNQGDQLQKSFPSPPPPRPQANPSQSQPSTPKPATPPVSQPKK